MEELCVARWSNSGAPLEEAPASPRNGTHSTTTQNKAAEISSAVVAPPRLPSQAPASEAFASKSPTLILLMRLNRCDDSAWKALGELPGYVELGKEWGHAKMIIDNDHIRSRVLTKLLGLTAAWPAGERVGLLLQRSGGGGAWLKPWHILLPQTREDEVLKTLRSLRGKLNLGPRLVEPIFDAKEVEQIPPGLPLEPWRILLPRPRREEHHPSTASTGDCCFCTRNPFDSSSPQQFLRVRSSGASSSVSKSLLRPFGMDYDGDQCSFRLAV